MANNQKFDRLKLDEAIKKAEPNLSKIKNVDEWIDDIRGRWDELAKANLDEKLKKWV